MLGAGLVTMYALLFFFFFFLLADNISLERDYGVSGLRDRTRQWHFCNLGAMAHISLSSCAQPIFACLSPSMLDSYNAFCCRLCMPSPGSDIDLSKKISCVVNLLQGACEHVLRYPRKRTPGIVSPSLFWETQLCAYGNLKKIKNKKIKMFVPRF